MSDDPFFDELRRLQPKADLVVLPPEPRAADAELTPPAVAKDLVGVAVQVADDVVAAGGLDVAFRFDRWEQLSGGLHEHLTRIRVDTDGSSAALGVLLQVRAFLIDAGWLLRDQDTPVPWFVGEAGEGLWRCDVSVEDDAVFVEIATTPLRLEEDPA